MHNLSTGQVIYLKAINNRQKRDGSLEVREARISKVGKKYFETDETYFGKFVIETMLQKSEYSPSWKAYLSMHEIQDENEFEALSSKMRSFFYSHGKLKLTLHQLRRIDEIISL